jgi:uncharacterized protein
MKRRFGLATAAIALLALASSARADVKAALDQSVLPAFKALTAATDTLSQTAKSDCTVEAIKPDYNAAWDAWMGVSHLGIGPSNNANLTIALWPDVRGLTQKAIAAALAEAEVPATAEAIKARGAASRGLTALDMLLSKPDYKFGDPSCTFVQAVTADLAANAKQLELDWQAFAATLQNAGAAGNTTYLTENEAKKALFTQLLTGLEFAADQRLGRPMGEPGKARPTRAEAWRTGRPVANIRASLIALQGLAKTFAGQPLPQSEQAFSTALATLDRLSDPTLQDLDDPRARFRAEVAQQRIRDIRGALEEEIGAALGIKVGFNSLDGD